MGSPVLVFLAGITPFHGDAVVHRTNQHAKITADAFLVDDLETPASVAFIHFDRLMRGVFTGNEAQPALDAKFLIDAGLDIVFQIQILPVHYIFCSHSTEVLDLLVSLFVHPMIQSLDHIFDDPETIVHDGGANLHSLSPHGHEFRRIFPVGNTSYG